MRRTGIAALIAAALIAFVAAMPAKAEGVNRAAKMAADPVVETVKSFQPYIMVFSGISAIYGDGKIGGFSDGGFDASVLVGGAAGFTAPLGDKWFWGLETSVERRFTSEDATPFSFFVHGGDLRYTVGLDGILGTALSEKTKLYAKGGYRWGWSGDIASNFGPPTSINVPMKSGPEAGIGISHDLMKHLALDISVMGWFPNDVTAGPGGALNLNGTDITARAGLKLSF